MTNLLKETNATIKRSGHHVKDIVFIGSRDGVYKTSWAEFRKIADVEYDSGFGAAEVAPDLIIVFSDGKKMWRGEYDGSEWWEFDSPDTIDYTQNGKPIKSVVGRHWATLHELHDEDSYKFNAR